MAAQKGREILIKRHDGTSYVTIGGMRQKNLRLNGATPADVSDSDSTWRELLAGAGFKSVAISGNGVFKDQVAENAVHTDLLGDVATLYQFIVPGFGTYQGLFVCTGMDFSGSHVDEVSRSMSWESAGAVTFTPA